MNETDGFFDYFEKVSNRVGIDASLVLARTIYFCWHNEYSVNECVKKLKFDMRKLIKAE